MTATTTDPPRSTTTPPPRPTPSLGVTVGIIAAVLAALLLVPPALGALSGSSDGTQLKGLRFMVPNTPGSGYDVTARAAQNAMEKSGVAGSVEVFNLPGAGGTVGLRRVANSPGNERLIMSMGLGLVGSIYSNKSPVTLANTTPIARLTSETEIFVVPKASPFQTMQQLVDAWRADPKALPVGGGSSPGGPDYLAPMLTAKAAGIDPRTVNYVAYDGGGELLAAVLGGKLGFAVSGLGEFVDQIQSGDLRVLAVTAGERSPGVNAPTLREIGIDVEFTNWRGIVAAPGLTDEQRTKLVEGASALHGSSQWRDVLQRNDWQDAYLPGPAFGAFLVAEDARVAALLRELGVAK